MIDITKVEAILGERIFFKTAESQLERYAAERQLLDQSNREDWEPIYKYVNMFLPVLRQFK